MLGIDFDEEIEWREPYSFYSELAFVRCDEYCKVTIWVDEQGTSYIISILELVALMQKTVITKGTVKGIWTFTKRGMQFSLKWIAEEFELCRNQ